MAACQFAAACVCQRTQIITRRDPEKPGLFMGMDVWGGGDFDGDDFLLVIIQQYYRFQTVVGWW